MAVQFPEAIRPLRRVEYDKLIELGVFVDETIELLDGVLVPMSPIGPPHSATVQRLNAILVPALAGRALICIQSPFAALNTSEPEPDVAVVPLGDYDAAHPDRAYLVIEVAESSLARDRGVKSRIYASSGVPEYWIVNLLERRIEVFSDPMGGTYSSVRSVEHSQALAPARFPDLLIAVADVIK